MSKIELDSKPFELDTMMNVSINYSFNPLKEVLALIVKKLNDNEKNISDLKDQLEIERYIVI